ncbi:MAG: hypothetical protein KY464_12630 [Gemmatimonadetes bacterium]|nr:hypothetical protein [Gemmatimonadota bacterium]
MLTRIIRKARPAAWARLGLTALALVACPLAAQEQPVAFVHGFFTDAPSWDDASNALAREFAISPLRPELTWTRRFEPQRATLESELANRPAMPAVGHSNGGLVSRYHVGASGTNTVDRIMAVNSGHHGAPLAANILNYKAKVFVVSLQDALLAPWEYQLLKMRGADVVRQRIAGFFVGVVQAWDPLNAPVLHDMAPGSNALARIEANRGTEQARAWSRVGVGTSAKPDGIMCHGLKPESPNCNRTLRIAQFFYLAAGAYNVAGSWFPLPGAKPHVAPFWFYGSYRLARVNVDWLRLIGAGGTWNGITGRPAPSDGILPLSSQQYPGATNQVNLTLERGYNISHQEANDANRSMLETFSRVFKNDFGVALRNSAGGEPEPEPWQPPCDHSSTELVCAQ